MNRVVGHGANEVGISVSALCERLKMSRQNYYAARSLRQRRLVDEGMIVELVKRERRMQPRLWGRKLLHLLRPELAEAGVDVGRDRFFEVLVEADLLVVPKTGTPRTTNSRHSLPVFGNLLVKPEGHTWTMDIGLRPRG